ncbi:hypothetical protein CTAYLR_000418 [Chrysophaeum taylorii]|uniref:Uncharacterized protein n=1 Tax=Chrysophaeum taylorii TaxID=2483200 RepID=A0AAD7UG92_9STRA|nr:hypothetical protein CTAYLR_000418 [Chrysophaeum taylorii]
MSRFNGKKAVVTGGSSGIGLATAKRLLAEGATVLVTGTNPERLKAAEEAGLLTLKNDAGKVEDTTTLAEAVSEKLGSVDACFLNAGFGRFFPIEQVTAEEFDEQFHVNVRGPLLEAKALGPFIVEGGSILLNTSVARELGMPGSSIYAATKGALRTMVRVMAREFAGKKVRVNAVSPGPIDSAFFSRTGMDQASIEGMAKQILSQVPLGRFGTNEDVAAVACFLLSDDAAYVTGSEYKVDGGMTEL